MTTQEDLEKRIVWLDEQLIVKKRVIDKELFQLEAILKELISLRDKLKQLLNQKLVQ